MSDWKAKPVLLRDPFMTSKVDQMVALLKEKRKFNTPRPVTTEQAGSTAKLLAAQASRDPQFDEIYAENKFEAPYPEAAIADADAERVFRELNKVSQQDVMRAEESRRKQKNELGQSELSATTPENREKAIHHFMVSPGVKAEDLTPKDLARITGLEPIKSEAPKPLELKQKKTLGGLGRSVMEMLWGKK